MAQREETECYSLANYLINFPTLCSLVNRVNLEQYYAGTNVVSAPRFRDFFKWLKTNDARLLTELKQDIKDGRLNLETTNENAAFFAIGLWLGVRYLSEQYKQSNNQELPKIQHYRFPRSLVEISDGYIMSENIIYIPKGYMQIVLRHSAADAFVFGFNGGIHETTHALPCINGKQQTLSEFATFITQTKYGLPLKSKTAKDLGIIGINKGVRDFVHIRREEEQGRLPSNPPLSLNEYLIFGMGPWLLPFFKDVNIFTFVHKKGSGSPLGVVDLLFLPNQDVTSQLGTRIASFLFDKQSLESFFDNNGIHDPVLKKKLKEAVEKMKKIGWKDYREMLDVFERVMTDTFGKPHTQDIPDGFVLNSLYERTNLALAQLSEKNLGATPKKVS